MNVLFWEPVINHIKLRIIGTVNVSRNICNLKTWCRLSDIRPKVGLVISPSCSFQSKSVGESIRGPISVFLYLSDD
jgi:hypothetical protein